WASTLATASRNSDGRLCTGMIVLTSPSTNIWCDAICARPHFQDQETPSKVSEDTDGAREGIPCPVVHKVLFHCRAQAKGLGPSPIKDDTFGKTTKRRLLVQPGCCHAAPNFRPSQRLLRQQLETTRNAPQHVFLCPFRQEQVFWNSVRDLGYPLIKVRYARL